MAKKPNILLIMTDQHRFDRLSCTGDPVLETPHIDSLAEAGVLFPNAYTPSPVCAPARAAIKSGTYPPGCGVVTNWVPFKPECTELMTHRLQENGYQTALCGKLHFVPHQEPFGFDYKRLHDAPYSIYADDDKYSEYIAWLKTSYQERGIDPVALFDEDESAFERDDWYQFIMGSNFRREAEHDIPWVVDESLHFLDTRDPNQPFFLFTSFFGPHQPFDPPAPFDSMFDPESVSLPSQFGADLEDNPVFQATCAERAGQFRRSWDERTYRRMIAAYYGQVAMIDHHLGRLLDSLKREGLWDDMLVVFVADHGDHNGAYGLFFKGEMYDSCCKVPLLIKPPRSGRGGVIRKEVVTTLDLYGTLLDYAGDSGWRQPHIEAGSLVPLLNADPESADWENRVFSIIGSRPHESLAMLRRDDLKLIRLTRGDAEPLYELYDMNDEVVEVRNLFDAPEYATERIRLKEELDRWWAEQVGKYPRRLS